jgi:cytochrome P450
MTAYPGAQSLERYWESVMSSPAMRHSESLPDAWSIPLDEIDVSDPELFRTNTMWPYFERLREEDPVHYYAGNSIFGPYWSVTKYKDIMQVEISHQIFSSEASLGGITLRDQATDFMLPMFIAMDPPKHDAQRKVVNPIVSPDNLEKLEGTIRERAGRILADR